MQAVESVVGKDGTLRIPKEFLEALGLREGSKVRFKLEKNKLLVEPVLDPFELALRGPKFARITFEELERASEELQHELLGS